MAWFLAPGEESELGGYLDDYQELAKDGDWHRFSALDNSARARFSLGNTITVDLTTVGINSVSEVDSLWVSFESMYGSGDVGTQPNPVSIWVDASQTGSGDGRIFCQYAARGNAFVNTDNQGGEPMQH